jgi:hypothetical protein
MFYLIAMDATNIDAPEGQPERPVISQQLGEVLTMSRCICREEGGDGSAIHDDFCGNVYMMPIKSRIIETYPCKNHEQNYIKAGWKIISKS